MARAATQIELTDDERSLLESWVRKRTTEQRLSQRARMILDAAAGKTTTEIAASLQVRKATVSSWRTRFARDRVAGLMEVHRTGKPAVYDETTATRILKKLGEASPELTLINT